MADVVAEINPLEDMLAYNIHLGIPLLLAEPSILSVLTDYSEPGFSLSYLNSTNCKEIMEGRGFEK